MIKSLLGNDEFMLGLGKRYMPQLLTNKALRSNVAKLMGGGLLGGLGFEEGRKLIRWFHLFYNGYKRGLIEGYI